MKRLARILSPIAMLALFGAGVFCSVMALMPPLPARAQFTVPGQPTVPLGFCQITALTGATSLSACAGGIPAGATMAVLQAEIANVRYRDDGTAPTTSIGEILISGGAPMPYVGRLSSLQFISATGAIDVLFYK